MDISQCTGLLTHWGILCYTCLSAMFKVKFEIIYPKPLNIFQSCVVAETYIS